MMTEQERFQRAFSPLHASPATTREVLNKMSNKTVYRKRFALLVAAAAVMSALTIAATAYTGRWDFWGASGHIEQHPERDRGVIASVTVDTAAEPPLSVEDGRVYFTANGEHRDITGELSLQNAYIYSFCDGEGVEHIFLLGLHSGEPDDFGWAEYLRGGDGVWLGGYAHNHLNGEEESPWFVNGKAAIHCPW